MLTTRFLN